MLPRARITEVLSDVDAWIGFADRFTHLRTGNPAADKPALLATMLADGTNLGLGYHHLVNVAQWHFRDDNYVAAHAAIIQRASQAPNDDDLGRLTGPAGCDSLALPTRRANRHALDEINRSNTP